jgi:N-methylhydantoinase A
MIIERKGAKTALITTEGFRDVLEIGRQVRPSLYNLFEDKPETLVKRSLRGEVSERTLSDGSVAKKVDPEEVYALLSDFKKQGVKSIAVCFLFSFLNNENEKIVERCVREAWPDVYCSVSSSILPEFREFERLSTTVINSYLGPKMKSYIDNLKRRVREINIPVEPYITQSNGGVMSIGATVEAPVQTALSARARGSAALFTWRDCRALRTLSPTIWAARVRMFHLSSTGRQNTRQSAKYAGCLPAFL